MSSIKRREVYILLRRSVADGNNKPYVPTLAINSAKGTTFKFTQVHQLEILPAFLVA